jgi:hypothetical protein
MFSIPELEAIQEALIFRCACPDDEMQLDASQGPVMQDYQHALSRVNALLERLAFEAARIKPMGEVVPLKDWEPDDEIVALYGPEHGHKRDY